MKKLRININGKEVTIRINTVDTYKRSNGFCRTDHFRRCP